MAAVPAGLESALKDRYRLDRELGQGGMATVYLAHDLKHDRDVALKVLRPELAAVLGADRFLREIRLTAHLQHPHILPVFDSGDAAGHLWYTMPFVAGESLRQRLIRERRLPLDEALRVTREIADALGHAHAEGVIHRDIKPENILLAGHHALVADFGIAKPTRGGDEHLTDTGLSVGTAAYMSPEQITGGAELDGRSDLYSLACVLYEMLTGELPHGGANAQAIIARRLTLPPPTARTLRPDLPEAIDRALQRALASVPGDRFASVEDFAAALSAEGSAKTAGQIATPASADRPPSASSWRRRMVLAGTVILLVCGLAVSWRICCPKPVTAVTNTIATLPFRVPNPALAEYREGLVDLFASAFDGAGGLRAIGARTALKRWHATVGPEGEGDDEAVHQVAQALGARYALTGAVIPLGASIKLQAEVHDLLNDSTYKAEADGAADSIAVLAQRVGSELLRRIAGPAARLVTGGPFATKSLEALKAYLEGEKAFRAAQFREAIAAFDRAIVADSTFALAQFRKGAAEGWTRSPHRPGVVPDAVLNALPRLGHRDSLMVQGTWELSQNLGASLQSLEALTREYPNDAEAWFLLGDAWYHLGMLHGVGPERVDSAFRRAIAFDSTFAPAYMHLIEDAFQDTDSTEAGILIRALGRFDSASPKTAGLQVAWGLAFGTATERAQARLRMAKLGSDALLPAKHAMNLNPDMGEYTVLVARAIASNGSFPQRDRAQAVDGEAIVETSRGHLEQGGREWLIAVRLLDSAQGRPLSSVWTPLRLTAGALAGIPVTTDRTPAWSPDVRRDSLPYAFGLIALARRNWSDVAFAASLLERKVDTLVGRSDLAAQLARQTVGRRNRAEAAQLRAWADWLRTPSPASLGRFETATDSLRPWHPFVRIADFALGAAFLSEGDLDRAERHMRAPQRWYSGFEGELLAPREYYLGRIAEERGKRADAREHYARFVRWWRDCDPELKPMWEDGRQRLATVSGEPREP